MMFRSVAVILAALVCLAGVMAGKSQANQVVLEPARLDPDLQVKDIGFQLGQLSGRLCNDSETILGEVGFLFRAYDRNHREIWQRVVDVYGIAPKDCRGFYERDKFDDYHEVASWDALPVYFNREKVARYDDINAETVIANLRLNNSNLSGRLCNNSPRDLSDLYLSIYASKFGQGLIERERRYVGDVQAGECLDFALHLDPKGAFDARQQFKFGLIELPAQGESGNGGIVPGLDYEGLQYYHRWLTVTLVNHGKTAQENVFVKFYGLGSGEAVVVAQSFFVAQLAPGQRLELKKRLLEDKKISRWRFSVVGWE